MYIYVNLEFSLFLATSNTNRSFDILFFWKKHTNFISLWYSGVTGYFPGPYIFTVLFLQPVKFLEFYSLICLNPVHFW